MTEFEEAALALLGEIRDLLTPPVVAVSAPMTTVSEPVSSPAEESS